MSSHGSALMALLQLPASRAASAHLLRPTRLVPTGFAQSGVGLGEVDHRNLEVQKEHAVTAIRRKKIARL
jgi:hypothetical protein